MGLNQNAGYGAAQLANMPYTTGRLFVVAASTDVNINDIQQLYIPQYDGVVTAHPTFTAALAQTVAGRGDIIMVSPNYTTAMTAAELLLAETNGVNVMLGGSSTTGNFFTNRATATLPATTTGALFTVTGKIRLLSIIGEVTTVTGATATNAKLIATPTVGSAVDICAAASVASLAVGSQLFITGTLATALQTSAGGAMVYQAASLIVVPGTIGLNTTATNTGSIKWRIEYQQIDAGAKVLAA